MNMSKSVEAEDLSLPSSINGDTLDCSADFIIFLSFLFLRVGRREMPWSPSDAGRKGYRHEFEVAVEAK